jgi:hypothetical protein
VDRGVKKTCGVLVLVVVFIGTLVMLYGLNLTAVVATSATSAECFHDSDCDDDDRWCEHNTVHEGVCNGDGECEVDHNDNCDIPAGGTCVEEDDWAWCEMGPGCTYDSDCGYFGYGAYCSGNTAYNGYCDGNQECKISQEYCTSSGEHCATKGTNGAKCVECTMDSHCDDDEYCYIGTVDNVCINGDFEWDCNKMLGFQGNVDYGSNQYDCSKRSDVTGNNIMSDDGSSTGGTRAGWRRLTSGLCVYSCSCVSRFKERNP